MRCAHQYPQVAHVCSGRSRLDCIFKRAKKCGRTAVVEKMRWFQRHFTGAFDCRAVCDCAGGRTVAVNSICSRAKRDEFSVALTVLVYRHCEAQRCFRISTANTVATNWTREL